MSYATTLASARQGSGVLVLAVLNLLFPLGLVEYRPGTDAFEYYSR